MQKEGASLPGSMAFSSCTYALAALGKLPHQRHRAKHLPSGCSVGGPGDFTAGLADTLRVHPSGSLSSHFCWHQGELRPTPARDPWRAQPHLAMRSGSQPWGEEGNPVQPCRFLGMCSLHHRSSGCHLRWLLLYFQCFFYPS